MRPAAQLLLRAGDMGMARSHESEFLDAPTWSDVELATAFRDLERVNRYLGGYWLTRKCLERVMRNAPPDGVVRVLDVGSGSGDIPRDLIGWFRRQGYVPEITAVDVEPRIVELASKRRVPGLTVERGDARQLSYSNKNFDWAVCSLFLHHLEAVEAVRVLREMSRVSRRVIVNDLVRNPVSEAVARIGGRFFTYSHITLHDGPLSIRRSYTLEEMLGLIRSAGMAVRDVRQFLLYRVAVLAEPVQ